MLFLLLKKFLEAAMCGRFVGYRGIAELKDVFPIDLVETEVSPNYNVAPTQNVLSIIRRDD
jgi:putative SOS response-associated peptidase YedK